MIVFDVIILCAHNYLEVEATLKIKKKIVAILTFFANKTLIQQQKTQTYKMKNKL